MASKESKFEAVQCFVVAVMVVAVDSVHQDGGMVVTPDCSDPAAEAVLLHKALEVNCFQELMIVSGDWLLGCDHNW